MAIIAMLEICGNVQRAAGRKFPSRASKYVKCISCAHVVDVSISEGLNSCNGEGVVVVSWYVPLFPYGLTQWDHAFTFHERTYHLAILSTFSFMTNAPPTTAILSKRNSFDPSCLIFEEITSQNLFPVKKKLFCLVFFLWNCYLHASS